MEGWPWKKNKFHKDYNFKKAQLQKLVCKLQLFHDCISSFVPKNQTVKREELFLILYLFSLTQNNGNTIWKTHFNFRYAYEKNEKMPGSNPLPTQQGLGTWTKYTVVALLANLLLKEVSTSSELI